MAARDAAGAPENQRDSQRLVVYVTTVLEQAVFVELLSVGYEDRTVVAPDAPSKRDEPRNAVSWSNHLSPEATRIKLQLERVARAGDPPTRRLQTAWREAAEDMVWAVVNSPEFLFVP